MRQYTKDKAEEIACFSENLRLLRTLENKTLRDVASSVGLTATSLNSYENGSKTPLLSNALKLAEYYGVTVDDLCHRHFFERSEHK